MHESPLFQHADEQEAVYAPEQLPGITAAEQAASADAHSSDQSTATVPMISIAAAGAVATGSSYGRGLGAAAMVGAAALAQETDNRGGDDRRS